MLRQTLSSAAILAAVSFCATPVLAGDVTFVLSNATSVDMMEFYASPTSADDWEDDILGEHILAAGESAEVTIADDRGCDYDIKAVFADGDEVTDQVDICELEEYVVGEE